MKTSKFSLDIAKHTKTSPQPPLQCWGTLCSSSKCIIRWPVWWISLILLYSFCVAARSLGRTRWALFASTNWFFQFPMLGTAKTATFKFLPAVPSVPGCVFGVRARLLGAIVDLFRPFAWKTAKFGCLSCLFFFLVGKLNIDDQRVVLM